MLHGLSEILPDQLDKRLNVIQMLADCFQKNGFSRMTTPTFEPYSDLSAGWDDFLKDISIQFFNNEGTLMVLRPEMTSPIARLICSRRKQLDLPLKLYYAENVFRKTHVFRKQEMLQVGLECFGRGGLEADVEVVHVLMEALSAVGVINYVVELGHIENVQDKSERELRALLQGDYASLVALPRIGDAGILKAGSHLKEFADAFQKAHPKKVSHVQYNLGRVEAIAYYSGIIFNVMVPGVGYVIGSGGRYDGLMARYGWDVPAVGFALEFDKLALALEKP